VPTYGYPTPARLKAIEQEIMPTLTLADPIFADFPIATVDEDILRWEQKDNYLGLQQVRGLNGLSPRVGRIGAKGYLAEPGVYGEHVNIDEREITRRRQLGTFDQVLDLTDLVTEAQEQLLHRRITRLRQIIWTLLSTGTFSVANGQGVVIHTDTRVRRRPSRRGRRRADDPRDRAGSTSHRSAVGRHSRHRVRDLSRA
jgi:hypothetical protein